MEKNVQKLIEIKPFFRFSQLQCVVIQTVVAPLMSDWSIEMLLILFYIYTAVMILQVLLDKR